MQAFQHRFIIGFFAVFALFGLASAASASIIYNVSVNTAAISGTAGNIDFQFNAGGPAQPATVIISSFAKTGGTLGAATATTGVTGTLPGTVTIPNNASGFNDYSQAFTFGTGFQFQLSFTGPAITNPDGTSVFGSSFGLSLFNSDFSSTFLTTNPDGFAATAEVNLNGSVTPATYPSDANGGRPAVTFSTPPSTPEPSSLSLMVLPFLVLAGSAIRRKIRF